MGSCVHLGTVKCKILAHLHRYEVYVDQHYKEFLKNQGKVDSVRLGELAGSRTHGETQEESQLFSLLLSSLSSCKTVF